MRIAQSMAILLAAILIYGSSGYAFLKTDGTQIVDSTGTPVLLKGYGLGGWLVPEGYMLHIPGFGSPTSIRTMIEELIGLQNTADFYTAYEANYVREADIDQIAQWGFNSIRLPFHYKTLYDTDSGSFREEGFAIVDSLIAWCRRNDLYLILDMHCAPGGQNKDNISDSDGIEARLWTEPLENQALTIEIWEEIAQRYKDEPVIGGYDLLNEPVLPAGYSSQVLRDFYVQLSGAIRQIDTHHIIFIEGNWYATDFTLLTPPWDSNMVYSFHKYWNDTTIGTIQGYIAMSNQFNVPLWMGESGENSNPWYHKAVRLFEDNGIGWCWWAHKKVNTITSPLSVVAPPGYLSILNYWNGQGSQPSVTTATAALMQLTEALKLEDCRLRPGVIPSLMNEDFGSISAAFTDHTLPGVIEAVQYDVGSNGVAYIDVDYQNTAGAGGPWWNSGTEYRNDGVDIEACLDPLGYAYNVGWIEGGERLIYTANIQTGGYYRLEARVASLNGEGGFLITVDGQPVSGVVDIPLTAGWQQWTTVSADSILLPAGTHTISMLMTQSGFNVNRLTFTLTATGINEQGDVFPGSYRLEQNYPNPFNPTTIIDYHLPAASDIELSIYNPLGQQLRTLAEGRQTAGAHRVVWDGRDDVGRAVPSGVYFYQLDTGRNRIVRRMLLVK